MSEDRRLDRQLEHLHVCASDRTNVVQSTLAKWILEQQLETVGIFKPGEGLEKHPELWFTFRNGERM